MRRGIEFAMTTRVGLVLRLAVIALFVGLVGACGRDVPPTPVVKATPASDAAASTGSAVDRADSEDPAETVSAENGDADEGISTFVPVDELGEIASAAISGAIRDRLVLTSGCADVDLSRVELTDPADARDAIELLPPDVREPLEEAFDHLADADAACNDRTQWVPAVQQAMEAFETFGSLIGAVPPADDNVEAPDDLTVVSAQAANLVDRLNAVLRGRNPLQSSDLWFSASHLAHIDGLRSVVAGNADPPTMLVLGSAVVARGIDPQELSSATRTDVVSFALIGATMPVHVVLADQALTIAPTIDEVVWGLSSHPFHSCRPTNSNAIDAVRAMQDASFGGVQDLTSRPFYERLLGPVGEGAYGISPLTRAVEQFHGEWDRGATLPFEGIDEARASAQRDGFVNDYAAPQLCDEGFDSLADGVGRWRQAGIDVTVFVPPLSDALVAIHPDGRSGHDAVIERMRSAVERSGGRFADLSSAVDDDGFFDLTHVNSSGRVTFTAALGELLAANAP